MVEVGLALGGSQRIPAHRGCRESHAYSRMECSLRGPSYPKPQEQVIHGGTKSVGSRPILSRRAITTMKQANTEPTILKSVGEVFNESFLAARLIGRFGRQDEDFISHDDPQLPF